jgi:hypothetical protein
MARADTYRSPVVQRLKSVRVVHTGLVGAGMELGCFLGRVHNTTVRVHNTTVETVGIKLLVIFPLILTELNG